MDALKDAGPAIHERRGSPAVPVSLLLLVATLYLFLLQLSWTYPPDPDGAAITLAAEDIAHGNVFLRGWSIPADPYLSFDLRPFDLPLYTAGVALTGMNIWLLHAVPAFLCVILIIVTGATILVRSSSAARRGGLSYLAAGLCLLPLAMPSHVFGYLALIGSNHISAIAATLAALLALEAAPLGPGRPVHRRSLVLAAGAFVLLTLGLIGDTMLVGIAVLPLVVVAGASLLRVPRGAEERTRSFVAAGVALAAVAAALTLRWLATRFGGINPTSLTLELHSPRLGFLPSTAFALVGLNDGQPTVPASWTVPYASLTDVRVVAFGASLYVTARVLTRWLRGKPVDWLSSVLSVATAAVIGGYVLWGIGPVRYLLPTIIFAAAIAGRQLITWRTIDAVRPWAVAVFVVALACYTAAPAVRLVLQPPPVAPVAIGAWLQAHGLTQGYADWAHAPLIAVSTGGAVRTYTVGSDGGRLVPSYPISRADSYQRRRSPTFVLIDRLHPQDPNVSAAAAERTFGAADRQIAVGPYVILIWNHPIGF